MAGGSLMKNTHAQHSNNLDTFDLFLCSELQKESCYLEDDDFTRQVMKKLPQKKTLSRLQENLILFVPLIVISLTVFAQLPILAFVIKIGVLFTLMNATSIAQLSLLLFLVAILSASYWLAKKFRIISF
jgi:hypothetical protein